MSDEIAQNEIGDPPHKQVQTEAVSKDKQPLSSDELVKSYFGHIITASAHERLAEDREFVPKESRNSLEYYEKQYAEFGKLLLFCVDKVPLDDIDNFNFRYGCESMPQFIFDEYGIADYAEADQMVFKFHNKLRRHIYQPAVKKLYDMEPLLRGLTNAANEKQEMIIDTAALEIARHGIRHEVQQKYGEDPLRVKPYEQARRAYTKQVSMLELDPPNKDDTGLSPERENQAEILQKLYTKYFPDHIQEQYGLEVEKDNHNRLHTQFIDRVTGENGDLNTILNAFLTEDRALFTADELFLRATIEEYFRFPSNKFINAVAYSADLDEHSLSLILRAKLFLMDESERQETLAKLLERQGQGKKAEYTYTKEGLLTSDWDEHKNNAGSLMSREQERYPHSEKLLIFDPQPRLAERMLLVAPDDNASLFVPPSGEDDEALTEVMIEQQNKILSGKQVVIPGYQTVLNNERFLYAKEASHDPYDLSTLSIDDSQVSRLVDVLQIGGYDSAADLVQSFVGDSSQLSLVDIVEILRLTNKYEFGYKWLGSSSAFKLENLKRYGLLDDKKRLLGNCTVASVVAAEVIKLLGYEDVTVVAGYQFRETYLDSIPHTQVMFTNPEDGNVYFADTTGSMMEGEKAYTAMVRVLQEPHERKEAEVPREVAAETSNRKAVLEERLPSEHEKKIITNISKTLRSNLLDYISLLNPDSKRETPIDRLAELSEEHIARKLYGDALQWETGTVPLEQIRQECKKLKELCTRASQINTTSSREERDGKEKLFGNDESTVDLFQTVTNKYWLAFTKLSL